jgi:hypothetical protein
MASRLLLGTVAAIACASAAAPLEARAPPSSPGAFCPTPSPQGIVRTVSLQGRPRFLLLRKQTLWVAIAASRPGGRGMLAQVDARSGHLQRIFRLPYSPYRIAYGFGSLWLTGEARAVTRRYVGAVLRLDPRSGRVLRVIHGPILFGAAIVTTPDGVWVGGGDVYAKGHPDKAGVRFVFRIDPRRNAVAQRLRLRSTTVIDLLAEGRSLWATGWGGVVRLSPSGRVLFQQRFYGSGWSLTRSPGSVWIAQRFSGNRFPRTQRPVRKLLQVTIRPQRLTVKELDSTPGLLSAAGGAVWLTGPGGLIRIAATDRPPTLDPIAVGVNPNQVAAFPGGVWGTVGLEHELVKICWQEQP